LGLAAQPLPHSSYFIRRNIGNLECVFILSEVSVYSSKAVKLDLSARNHLAMGEVPAGLLAEIKSKLARLRQGAQVDEALVQNYAQALKILLVHYAVDDRAVLGVLPSPEEFALPHECKGLGDMVRELSEDLHFVVHGHLHYPKVYNHKGVQVIAATTTTQKKGYNGFFILKFFASGDVLTEHHRWGANSFSMDDNPDLNVRILTLPNVSGIARSTGGGLQN
jgi:hypothetical protein